MNEPTFSADDIAAFLTQHPDFFTQHAELFADLRVPHPYETRAISLGERQILLLRDKVKELEQRLHQQAYYATHNQKISHQVSSLFAWMMSKTAPEQIPHWIVESILTTFDYAAVALRLWDLTIAPDATFTQDVTAEIKAFAAQLTKPYCGKPQEQPVLTWLPTPPASLAILPLTKQDSTFGLLVLASDDANHFTADMGTTFLATLSDLASLALSPLR